MSQSAAEEPEGLVLSPISPAMDSFFGQHDSDEYDEDDLLLGEGEGDSCDSTLSGDEEVVEMRPLMIQASLDDSAFAPPTLLSISSVAVAFHSF